MKSLFKACAAALMLCQAAISGAAEINLSSWTELTLNFSGGQPSGDWILDGDNLGVTQVINADPSFYLNNLNQTSYTIDGSWQVETSSDNDFMGFVFGYQNSSNFYLFDWKQATQNNTYGANASEGMTIKKYEGATGSGLLDLSLGEFWENVANRGDMTVLDQNHGSAEGWADNAVYDFHLEFNETPGQFRIQVTDDGGGTLWDTTVVDSTFTFGQFGFYNFSQARVHYEGFEQTGGVILPEPGTLALLGLALCGLNARRRQA